MCSCQICIMFLLFLWLTVAAADSIPVPKVNQLQITSGNDYRISNTTIPTGYDIELRVPLAALQGQNTTFSGHVKIYFTVTEPKSVILINSLVDITNMTLSHSNVLPENTPPANYNPIFTVNRTTEITRISLSQTLLTGVDYCLDIHYTSNLDPVNMIGFYRSQYVANNVVEYLGTTQFQPTHARRAFPCFDEPQYKAKFNLTIVHPREFTAVANTPVLSSQPVPVNEPNGVQYNTTIFAPTSNMSTYLLAFTVSKFNCNKNVTSEIPFGVCSRTDYENQTGLALEYGVKLMAAMEEWTNLSYSSMGVLKMDQFAIPDFLAGAMENWGLVTYREPLILYDEQNSSNEYKQKILTIIAHEFAHMWFGNYLTTAWWDTLFLNEGFASYFEYLLLTQVPELQNYEMEKQFITDMHQNALLADASLSSPALISEAWTPSQIWNKFNAISYHKGAAVLRMVENLMGTTNFQAGLRQYLKMFPFKTVSPEGLWNSLSSEIPSGILPNISFTNFIGNWTTKAGYPVITATVDGNDIVLKQKRFLYNGNDTTQWYVPIYYKDQNSVVSLTWLVPNGTVTLQNAAANNSWVILNHNATGFYRVHYDSTLRQRIMQQDDRILTDLNKAQIIDDALNLARARQIKYSEAFQMLSCLRNETSYYPWVSAIRGLNFLSTRLGDSDMGRNVNRMILELIEKIWSETYNTNWTSEEHVTSLKRQRVWSLACKVGHSTCISESRRMFSEFKANNTRLINPNIRSIVYCNALRHSTNYTDWNFLWSRFNTNTDTHEEMYLLSTLGCTKNVTNLEFLLNQTVSNSSGIRLQDFNTVWSSVYGSGPAGLGVALKYFISNYDNITTYYPDAVSLLPSIASMITTHQEIGMLEQFLEKEGMNSTHIGLVTEAALISAKQNLEWQSSIMSDLAEHFRSAAPSLQLSFSLILVAIITKLLVL